MLGWNCFSIRTVIFFFHSMPTTATNCVRFLPDFLFFFICDINYMCLDWVAVARINLFGRISYWFGRILYWFGRILYWFGRISYWFGRILYWFGRMLYWYGRIYSQQIFEQKCYQIPYTQNRTEEQQISYINFSLHKKTDNFFLKILGRF